MWNARAVWLDSVSKPCVCHTLYGPPYPLQVFRSRQTLQFWNSLAVLPVGSLYHTVCLDSLADAFQGGAGNINMASYSSLAACLRSVGFEVPRVHDVVPLLDVDGVVEALTRHLHGTGSSSLYSPRAAPTQGVVSCTYEHCGSG